MTKLGKTIKEENGKTRLVDVYECNICAIRSKFEMAELDNKNSGEHICDECIGKQNDLE